MNINFKARLEGIGEQYTREAFWANTANYPKHKMIYKGKDKDIGWDEFSLERNGEYVTKYLVPNTINKRFYSTDELLKVFRILQIKEATIVIEKRRKEKIDKEKAEYDKNL